MSSFSLESAEFDAFVLKRNKTTSVWNDAAGLRAACSEQKDSL